MPLYINAVIEISGVLCLLTGSFFCISGGVGIVRFPDFYTRMHAVGVTDTLAAGMVLTGLMLQSQESLVVVKLLMIFLMTLFINPSASHALAKAAFHSGLEPLINNNESNSKTIDKKEGNNRVGD